ncbi:MAG: DUF2634 domain-containing protein [Oscillospiraceae bacterium]|nr:DUF2634 domain-containing protein [Oscillospiraceae bacterium]
MAVYEILPAQSENQDTSPSHTYKLDLSAGRIVGRVNGLEAVRQAAEKILLTERYDTLIYDSDYGVELRRLLYGESTTRELIESALPSLIEDALLADARIISVEGIELSFAGDALRIALAIQTTDGLTQTEVELNV